MNCPVCDFALIKTNIVNKIFDSPNYYCKACNSWHIVEEKSTKDYYAFEYHKKYNYQKPFLMLIKKLSLVSNRTLARFKYMVQSINVGKNSSYLEIGGAVGEMYTIINKKRRPKEYTIVEPSSAFNFSEKNVTFINDLFENVEITKLSNPHIIIMFHVLEHIFDLSKFFDKLKKLRPAYFYFEIPNCTNEQVQEDSLYNHPHYHHFSPKSIEIILKKHGLKKISQNIIEPVSYHPYKRRNLFFRYSMRLLNINEKIIENGIYIRGIYSF